jgi:hypothetical protein
VRAPRSTLNGSRSLPQTHRSCRAGTKVPFSTHPSFSTPRFNDPKHGCRTRSLAYG